MLILDLDDTIFQTSSINPKIVEPAIAVIVDHYRQETTWDVKKVIQELWTRPIDSVLSKYETPQKVVDEFYIRIGELDYKELDIKPFEDYATLSKIQKEKILVTTGLTELQNAKIDALGIRSDFKEIYIDDPRLRPRFGKFEIFSKILNETNLHAKQVWVIGDNPESEISAANKLGINTIQRSSDSKKRSEKANYYINSFLELSQVFNIHC